MRYVMIVAALIALGAHASPADARFACTWSKVPVHSKFHHSYRVSKPWHSLCWKRPR